jgi:hypothetical protein
MTGKALSRVLLALVLLSMAGACTRNDDVGAGEVTFKLPTATFTVTSDSNDSRWRPMPPEGIPNVICSGAAALTEDCCNPPARGEEPAKSIDCRRYPMSCDADGWCALAFDFDAQVPIELGSLLALRARRGWVMASAEMAVIKSKLEETKTDEEGHTWTEEFPLESAALYVAPAGVRSPKDKEGRSHLLASIPHVPDVDVPLDANARSTLSTFLVDFNTPFTLILSVRVAIEAGHGAGTSHSLQPNEIKTATFTIDGDVRAEF